MMAGHGFQIGNGAGLPFITVAGFSIPIMAGLGCLVGSGHLLGLPGIMEVVGSAGLPFHLVLTGK